MGPTRDIRTIDEIVAEIDGLTEEGLLKEIRRLKRAFGAWHSRKQKKDGIGV
jgi:hypothetical protein